MKASCVGSCGDQTLYDNPCVKDIMKIDLIKNLMTDVFHLQSGLLPLQRVHALSPQRHEFLSLNH